MIQESLIQLLIEDYHAAPLPSLVPRRIDLEPLSGKANTLIGMRRVGKTFLCYQRIKSLLDQGIEIERTVYLNFEDERLSSIAAGDLQTILDVYYRIFPKHSELNCYFFFDEIQNVEGWERFIRRLIDTRRFEVWITGSSAKMLSAEVATSLRGRSRVLTVFPASFAERLAFHGIDQSKLKGSKQKAIMENQTLNYLDIGGFPEIQSLEKPYRIEILQEYYNAVLYRDVVDRHNISNLTALRALMKRCINQSGQQLSINRFYHDLRSRQISTSKDALYQYIDHLNDAFFLFPVKLLSKSLKQQQKNPPKIYIVDTGLILANSTSLISNKGRLLENAVLIELLRRKRTPYYFTFGKGSEIDFVYHCQEGKLHLLQVAWELDDPTTRQREIDTLRAAIDSLGASHVIGTARIVTLATEERLNDCSITPFWKWAMSAHSNP